VARWFDSGRLKGWRQAGTARMMFWTDTVKLFIREHKMHYPKEFDPSGFDCIELGC
jgi:hypothetical protein